MDDGALLRFLVEDVGRGDPSSRAFENREVTAFVTARAPCIVAGTGSACRLFALLGARAEALVPEGGSADGRVLVVRGGAWSVFAAERTALNLLGRLCSIAATARAFVERLAGTGCRVLDTRKTTPGLRALEKYAWRVGGAENHRLDLGAGVLLKDDHVRLAGGVAPALETARRTGLPVTVEVETEEELEEALRSSPSRILLDNWSVGAVSRAVKTVAGRIPLEASGGITLRNARDYAETGVDFISTSEAATRGAWADLALELKR